MKNIVIVIVVLMVITAGAGYFGIPVLVRNETAGLRSDVQDMKQRMEKMEEFMKSEEEARNMAQLLPDAEAAKVIKTVNSIAVRVSSLEKGVSVTNEAMIKQKETTEESSRKQSEGIEKVSKETKQQLQRIEFSAALANFRSHLLRVHIELRANNIASARNEMDFLNKMFDEARVTVPEKDKKAVEQFQATLKKARAEIDTDLPATINIVNSLWHDMGKLMRKD